MMPEVRCVEVSFIWALWRYSLENFGKLLPGLDWHCAVVLPPWSCRVPAWHLNAFWRGPGQSCSFPHLHYWSGTDSCWRASQRAGRCGETSGLHIYIPLSAWFHTHWTDIARSHGAWNCCRSWQKTQPKPQPLKQALKWKAWQRRTNTWGSRLFAKACDFNSIASPKVAFFQSAVEFLLIPCGSTEARKRQIKNPSWNPHI